MTEFDKEKFTKWVVQFLNEISALEVVLSNPKADSIFPCAVVGTPLDRVVRTSEGQPVEIALSVSVDYWANSKYECMRLEKEGIEKLRKLNLQKVNTNIDLYDDITKKYRLGGSYECYYNALTNSFENRR